MLRTFSPRALRIAGAILVTVMSLDSAALAEPVRVALQVQPGVGVPIGAFPSGVPLPVADPQGDIVGRPDSAVNMLVDLHPTPAFDLGVMVLLNNFVLGASFTVQRFSSVRVTDVAISRVNGVDLPEPLPNMYLKNVLGLQLSDRDEELLESPTIYTTRLSFGYRWYLLEGRFRPYVPVGFGPVFMVLEGSLDYGVHVFGGLGLDVRLADRFDLGLVAQYDWTGIVLPEGFQAHTAPGSVVGNVSAGRSVLGAFLKSQHTVQIALTGTVHF